MEARLSLGVMLSPEGWLATASRRRREKSLVTDETPAIRKVSAGEAPAIRYPSLAGLR